MMNFHKKQRGYVTLLTTLVLLIVMSLIVVYAAYSVTGQQRVLNNTYNQYQAVQAAEGGLNYAIAYFNTNTTGIFNTIANGSGLGNNQTYTIGTISGNTVQLSNMPISFSASYTQLSPTGSNPSAPVVIQVISTGYSTDNTTQHSISMNIASGNKGKPNAPVLAQSGFANQGAIVNITNNYSNNVFEIGSGGNTISTSHGVSTLSGSTYGGVTTVYSNQGTPAIVNNSSLASLNEEAYFEHVFHQTAAAIYNQATVITPADLYYGNLNPNNTTPAPQLLWLGVSPILNSTTDYLISGNVILGTATAPVTVIANRVNFRFAANASLTVNGLFYAGLNTFGAVSYGNFTVNVNGIYVARGNMINAYSQETLNVTYDQNIVNLLQGFNTYAPIPGSWRDF